MRVAEEESFGLSDARYLCEMRINISTKRDLSLWVVFSLITSALLLVSPPAAKATTITMSGASITASPSGASGTGTAAGTPLVYPSSISFGTQISWSFTAPSSITTCSIVGGSTVMTNVLTAATTSTTVCRISGTVTSDQAEGLVVLTVAWGVASNQSVTAYTSFQKEFNYGSNAVSSSMVLTGTNGMAIGSTISIATPTEWKNPYLNTLPASSFYGFAFISNAKCGEQNSSYTRVYFNNNDWNYAVNGFQIPASAVDANNRTIADLTGYGIEFNLHPTANNMMTNRVGPYKIGETSLVACTHPDGGGGFQGPVGSIVRGSAAQGQKYSGPEFSSFGDATLAGNKLTTSGKKLDSITSMKINGAAVTYKVNSANELEIELPKDLAPGKYDVEITSTHGKLTHLQGITIKAVVPTKELSFKAEGAWLNYGSLLELTNIAKQIGSEYTSVRCILNAADPVVAERLAKRACSYIEANRLRGKAVTYESKSTFKGEGFWVRIVANG